MVSHLTAPRTKAAANVRAGTQKSSQTARAAAATAQDSGFFRQRTKIITQNTPANFSSSIKPHLLSSSPVSGAENESPPPPKDGGGDHCGGRDYSITTLRAVAMAFSLISWPMPGSSGTS